MDSFINFDEFKTRRELWLACLNGNDRNSIIQQIFSMTWNSAVFKILNEARKTAQPAQEGGVQLNGMIHEFINDCFVENQLLFIRRLTDNYPIDGDKRNNNVNSLSALIKDMKEYAPFMTRENIFKAESLEYNYEPIQIKAEEYYLKKANTNKAFRFPEELKWTHLKERHEKIDKLAFVESDKRSPEDSINRQIFEMLEIKLNDVCSLIRKYVDKFVAHSATHQSRRTIDWENIAISDNHIWAAQNVICNIVNFISFNILNSGTHSFLAIAQFNKFAYIDRPLIIEKDIPKLEKCWESYENEMSNWNKLDIKEILDEIKRDSLIKGSI